MRSLVIILVLCAHALRIVSPDNTLVLCAHALKLVSPDKSALYKYFNYYYHYCDNAAIAITVLPPSKTEEKTPHNNQPLSADVPLSVRPGQSLCDSLTSRVD